MTNSETIEKLNEALTQLIDAYEILQDKNTSLENELEQKNDNINDLEEKLNELNGNTEVQSNKMDGMLNRIQSLLGSSNNSIKHSIDNDEIKSDEEEINLKISDDNDLDDKNTSNDENTTNNNKIDLGRMESLLNGLNTK